MVRSLLFIVALIAGCLPDITPITDLQPVCSERPATWSEAEWLELLAADNRGARSRWEADARCASYRARTALRAVVDAEEGDDADAALAAIEPVNDLAAMLTGALLARRFSCDCSTHRCAASIDIAAGGLTVLCQANSTDSRVVGAIAAQIKQHAGYAVEATSPEMRWAHSEHVLNCLQTGGNLDWDGDGDPSNPCIEFIDFGTTGTASSNLISMIARHWDPED
jgi:hypothetical protein